MKSAFILFSLVFANALLVATAQTTTPYLACCIDSETRDLPFKAYGGSNNTNANCVNWCSDAGYAFAGTQTSSECWCGNSYCNFGTLNDFFCSYPCSGNSSDKCGGYYKNSVSRTPTRYVGCFNDSTTRDLPFQAYSGSLNTPSLCTQLCSSAGYLFAGVQSGSQCWCGNSPGSQGRAPDTACNYACSGSNSLTCGGYFKNSVYRV